VTLRRSRLSKPIGAARAGVTSTNVAGAKEHEPSLFDVFELVGEAGLDAVRVRSAVLALPSVPLLRLRRCRTPRFADPTDDPLSYRTAA
jgi:hypothetical protein